VYYSPPLIDADERQFAYAMWIQDAIDEGYKPLDDRIQRQSNVSIHANPETMRGWSKATLQIIALSES